jgi:ATP-binding cassette, subfamily B, bacterial
MKWMSGQARPFIFSLTLITSLGAILQLSGVGMAIVSKTLIDAAAASQPSQMYRSAIIFIILILVEVLCGAVVSLITSKTSETISNSMRQNFFRQLTLTEWFDISKFHSGDILTRMTSDVGNVSSILVKTLPSIVSLTFLLVASFATLLFYEPTLALLVFMLSPFAIILSRFYGRKLKPLYLKMQEAESIYRSFIHESVQNMLIIKTFCLENNTLNHINELQNNRLKWVLKRSQIGVASNSVLVVSYWLGYFLAFVWGAFSLSKGVATFGMLTAFIQLVGKIQSPFIGLANNLPQIISAMASVDRIMEFEKLQQENNSTIIPELTTAGIEFENISFSYDRDKPVLTNISGKISHGEIAAIVGPSGEGKTTLLRLILSLVQPKSGNLYFVNGLNKYKVCSSTRRFVSYVPQGNTLFSGTIAENLRHGSPNATDKDLEIAAQAACAWDFISELKDGLYTFIGEKGLGLSEGQAQRLAIARALLHKSPILILDEATSALDVNTEFAVLQAIHDHSPGKTCIIVTHRQSVFKICNRIFKIENGHLKNLYNNLIEDSAIEIM